jgi:hypothetical protein
MSKRVLYLKTVHGAGRKFTTGKHPPVPEGEVGPEGLSRLTPVGSALWSAPGTNEDTKVILDYLEKDERTHGLLSIREPPITILLELLPNPYGAPNIYRMEATGEDQTIGRRSKGSWTISSGPISWHGGPTGTASGGRQGPPSGAS